MANPYQTASNAAPVTPSDSVNYGGTASALYVGTAGNVALVLPSGSVVVHTNVQGGSIIPCESIRVNLTNTTASNIVAYF